MLMNTSNIMSPDKFIFEKCGVISLESSSYLSVSQIIQPPLSQNTRTIVLYYTSAEGTQKPSKLVTTVSVSLPYFSYALYDHTGL